MAVKGSATRPVVTMVTLLLLLGLLCSAPVSAAAEAHAVPAIYVFGDSTVDVGNIQYLPDGSNLKFPYGIDFPNSAVTGRFSNGYNIGDFVAKLLGFEESPPPYLSLTPNTSHELMKGLLGASYAFGGSGLLDSTGSKNICMRKQIEYFEDTKANMNRTIDPKTLDDLLAKSLFLMSAGGNDLRSAVLKRPLSRLRAFPADMISNYSSHITALYNLGARKFGIISIPPVGCIPVIRVLNSNGDCKVGANLLAMVFNHALNNLMQNLSSKLEGMKYSIGSSYNIVSYFIDHPHDAGFEEVQGACCGGGRLNAKKDCSEPNTTYCANRNQYIFWDRVHGTQAAAEKGAQAAYSGNLSYAMPINFQQLVEENIDQIAIY